MVPQWAKGAIFYQIFPDRFYNGDRENDIRTGEYQYPPAGDVRFVEDWTAPVETFDVHRFYGGDLEGIRQKFGHIKSLGVDAILLNPIFTSPSNHKYDTGDYYQVDPHLTSKYFPGYEGQALTPNEYFARFVAAAHEAGLRIILDGVFNHCGITDKWCRDRSKEAYFTYDEDGKRRCWWGMETLPKLNYSCRALRQEILRIAAYWVSPPYNCDGWRLDVGADLGSNPSENHEFWREFRAAVAAANPEAFVFAEHYGDASAWLEAGEWDSVMNYMGFMEPVSAFFTGIDKHARNLQTGELGQAEIFYEWLMSAKATFPADSYMSALNQLDNHDHARYITRTAGVCGTLAELGAEAASDGVRRDVLLQSVVFQMTWPGCPGIYYGDETGLPGWTDPDNRRTYPWGHEDYELIDFYKCMGRIHHESKAFRLGDVQVVLAEGGCFGFLRSYESDCYLVLINREEREVTLALPLPEGVTAATRIMETGPGYNVGRAPLAVSEGVLPITLGAVTAVIIKLA